MLTISEKTQIDKLFSEGKSKLGTKLTQKNAIEAFKKYPSQIAYIVGLEVKVPQPIVSTYLKEKGYIRNGVNYAKKIVNKLQTNMALNIFLDSEGDYFKRLTIETGEGLKVFFVPNEMLRKLKIKE